MHDPRTDRFSRARFVAGGAEPPSPLRRPVGRWVGRHAALGAVVLASGACSQVNWQRGRRAAPTPAPTEFAMPRSLPFVGCSAPAGTRVRVTETIDEETYPQGVVGATIVSVPVGHSNACAVGLTLRLPYQTLVEESAPTYSVPAGDWARAEAYRWADGRWRIRLRSSFVGTNENEGTWVSTRVAAAVLLVAESGAAVQRSSGHAEVMVWLTDGSKRGTLDHSLVVAAEEMRQASYLFVLERRCRWAVTMRSVTSYDVCYFAGGRTNAPSMEVLTTAFLRDHASRISVRGRPGERFAVGDWIGLRLR